MKPLLWISALCAGGALFFTLLYFSPEKTVPLISAPPPPSTPLTLEEKIGQLFMVGHWANTPVASTSALISSQHIGGIIIMSSPTIPSEILTWTKDWQSLSQRPLFISTDQEGGPVQRLKGNQFTPTGQRDIHTATQAYTLGVTRGSELASLGINMNFAPVLDTARNPESFMYQRVFPERATSASLAAAMIDGMRNQGVIAVPKHFPGHDDTKDDSHLTLPVVDIPKESLAEFTAPFRELITQHKPTTLMTAHVQFPQIDNVPATLSHFFLHEYLRSELSFTGVIITDDMSMDAIDAHQGSDQASVEALQAGADMILFAAEPEKVRDAIRAVTVAVKNGTLPESRITESYERIQALKRDSLHP